jgi:hypothetical protein
LAPRRDVNLRATGVILQFTHLHGSRGPHMLVRRAAAITMFATALAACSTNILPTNILPIGIPDLNTHPTKYYQQSVSFTGRVSRMQTLEAEVLLEVADAHEHRILVRATAAPDVHTDDWVKVSGVLVPEARVGGRILYDVVDAESVSTTSAPWLRNLF